MRAVPKKLAVVVMVVTTMLACVAWGDSQAQRREGGGDKRRDGVRSVTIPVTVRLPESRAGQSELRYIDTLKVLEDGAEQEIISTRGATRAPLALTILVQDDLVPSISNEIRSLAAFIRNLPEGSRVFVGYIRAGSLQTRQRFTTDLERAAKALRIPIGSATAAPYNPYVLTIDALKRFESLPVGRRALLVISDGLDVSRGIESSSPTQSIDLQRAINEAQRRGVAVYSIYAPTVGGNFSLVNNGQSSLLRLSTETGGKAFFQGTSAPVSIDPFLRELNSLLARQFALTYLSTNTGKGFHRIEVMSNLPEGEMLHPAGYVR